MSADLFERLAERRVPPVPKNLSRRVHRRLNRVLVLVHATELAFLVLPYCAVCFARAVIGMISFTASGRYPEERSSRSDGDAR